MSSATFNLVLFAVLMSGDVIALDFPLLEPWRTAVVVATLFPPLEAAPWLKELLAANVTRMKIAFTKFILYSERDT